MAGACLAFKALSPDTELYTAEPVGHDDHARSFAAGERQTNAATAPKSVCDALMVPTPGKLTFAVNRQHVTAGVAVSDEQVLAAVRFAFDHLKLVAEPSGAAALAAVLSGKIETAGRKVGLIITGGPRETIVFDRAGRSADYEVRLSRGAHEIRWRVAGLTGMTSVPAEEDR